MTKLTAAVLHAAASGADPDVWLPALQTAFDACEVNTPRRIAAALGQFAVEAGEDFGELSENVNYTHADRIAAVWPTKFACAEAAASYCHAPERLANFVYAGKLGNGNTASGDGWRFRGRGLIQITGREEYSELAEAIDMTPEAAAAYCETPEGAAISGCWYLAANGCLPLADAWMLTAITKRVNGSAMLGWKERLQFSNLALKAFGNAA